MKRIATIILLFVFLISQSGLAITVHTCRGKISSFNLFSAGKHGCCCGKKPMKAGCCKDKTTILKIKNDISKVNSLVFRQILPDHIIIAFSQNCNFSLPKFRVFANSFFKPPPFKPKAPIYLLDGVFLIWFINFLSRELFRLWLFEPFAQATILTYSFNLQ